MASASKLEDIANTAPQGTKENPSGLENKLKGSYNGITQVKKYNTSVAIGQGIGVAATYAGVSNAERIAKLVPGLESLTATTTGLFGLGMVSNFIGDQLGFAGSLYAFNRERYKGISGKARFAKDYFNLGVRHFGSYLIAYPLAYLTTNFVLATGLLTGALAYTLPFAIVESVITGFGYILSTLRYRRRVGYAT